MILVISQCLLSIKTLAVTSKKKEIIFRFLLKFILQIKKSFLYLQSQTSKVHSSNG